MKEIQTWQEAFISSLQNSWEKFIGFLPNLIGALIILIVGAIIAVVLARIIRKVVNLLKVDEILEKVGMKKIFEGTGVRLDAAKLCGVLVKWFIIIVAFLAAADVLYLYQVTQFLSAILLYLPNVIVAVVILIIGIILGGFLEKVIKGSVKIARLVSAEFLGAITKWVVLVFSMIAALIQLKVAPELLMTFFTGLIAMLAIAGGIAFGFGGKDEARKILESIRKKISPDRGE